MKILFYYNICFSYGFQKNHCVEALRIMQKDVGKAYELLMSHYMNIDLPEPDNEVSEELLTERDEELSSLKEIFGDICEEKIPNQLFFVHLHLPYIDDNYNKKLVDESEKTKSLPKKIEEPKPALCLYFKKGLCRHGAKCRFSHHLPEKTAVVKSAVQDFQDELKSKYDLEIRFPKGKLKLLI